MTEFIETLLETPIETTLGECRGGDIVNFDKGSVYESQVIVIDPVPGVSVWVDNVLTYSTQPYSWAWSAEGSPWMVNAEGQANIEALGLDKKPSRYYYYLKTNKCKVVGRRVQKPVATEVKSDKMPIDKKTLQPGDRFKATIKLNGSSISTTGTFVDNYAGLDDSILGFAFLDCSFDFGGDNNTCSALDDPHLHSKKVEELGLDPKAKSYYWISRAHVVIDEIISHKAGAEAEQPKPEKVKTEAPVSNSIAPSELRTGDRIRTTYNGKLVDGTFLCLDCYGRPICINTSDYLLPKYEIDRYKSETQTRIRNALSCLNMDVSVFSTFAHEVERIDIDPTTLNIGDVVEITYIGNTYEATVVVENDVHRTQRYPVVFHTHTSNLFDPSGPYGDAEHNIDAMGLLKGNKSVVGWTGKAGRVVPIVKRLVQRGRYKMPRAKNEVSADVKAPDKEVKPDEKDVQSPQEEWLDINYKTIKEFGLETGDEITIQYNGDTYQAVYIDIHGYPYIPLKLALEPSIGCIGSNSLVANTMRGHGLSLDDYPNYVYGKDVKFRANQVFIKHNPPKEVKDKKEPIISSQKAVVDAAPKEVQEPAKEEAMPVKAKAQTTETTTPNEWMPIDLANFKSGDMVLILDGSELSEAICVHTCTAIGASYFVLKDNKRHSWPIGEESILHQSMKSLGISLEEYHYTTSMGPTYSGLKVCKSNPVSLQEANLKSGDKVIISYKGKVYNAAYIECGTTSPTKHLVLKDLVLKGRTLWLIDSGSHLHNCMKSLGLSLDDYPSHLFHLDLDEVKVLGRQTPTASKTSPEQKPAEPEQSMSEPGKESAIIEAVAKGTSLMEEPPAPKSQALGTLLLGAAAIFGAMLNAKPKEQPSVRVDDIAPEPMEETETEETETEEEVANVG